mmetsp:Transcript_27116/g.61802  ORF Transcript_27116/g.61802 Transcript_27116/m.61802 type:complete len:110 (-) Transcript_27116:558-887(-)
MFVVVCERSSNSFSPDFQLIIQSNSTKHTEFNSSKFNLPLKYSPCLRDPRDPQASTSITRFLCALSIARTQSGESNEKEGLEHVSRSFLLQKTHIRSVAYRAVRPINVN